MSLWQRLGLVHGLLLMILVFLLVVLRKLWILVRLLLKLPNLQTPQVDEEEKTGPHRHKQVPLLGLHVCCGGWKRRRWWVSGGVVEDEDRSRRRSYEMQTDMEEERNGTDLEDGY